MKQFRMFLVLVMSAICIILVVSTSAAAHRRPRSTVSMGNNSTKENELSLDIYSNQISDYKHEIIRLEDERSYKINELEKNIEVMLKNNKEDKYVPKINEAERDIKICKRETDSLISIYRSRIMLVDNAKIEFMLRSVKDKQQRIDLESYNAVDVARAYLYVKYADNMNSTSVDNNQKKLIGMVENTGYLNPVVAKVTGPANFYREFTLPAKSKSLEFSLPCIGEYTTVFYHGNETRCVTKEVGPNIVYYDGGKVLDFKATLLP